MCVGIATDHGGFGLKEELVAQLRAAGHEVVDFGAQPSVTLDDIRRFRQLDSRALGHPEYRWVSRVETTTGPLGQGVATSVGMAIAQKWLANRYNKRASTCSTTTSSQYAGTAA